ncbi:beta-N-acetylhexosaminidase [Luteipulveratus mongoliensis]|uniref:beta-N-acetylhexosaminidase n=1 Tax=Luteipulveratus mongoliensis TaxID=571913 RepID=A0A0K1JKI0_9MICO|nr:beta-N-acetylhexosaminidase [Luteipulveratus mongoliensis]AKU17103.1 hypothetical protein VV02_16605 [Luteipulveratus mongoliensis]
MSTCRWSSYALTFGLVLGLGTPVASAAIADDPGAEAQTADSPLALVPKPSSVEVKQNSRGYTLSPGSRIVTSNAYRPVAELLAQTLRRSTGYRVPVVTSGRARASDIAISRGDAPSEGYSLTASSSGAKITAATPEGAFNATQTLRQLLPAAVESPTSVRTQWSTPAVTISDAPRFAYRGVMIDVARSFQTPAELKNTINTLAAYKINRVHLHVADDQGWRIQITNSGKAAGDTIDYSRLTSVSGKTAMTEGGYQNEAGHTGFYTQDDYRSIVRYAQSRFIQIIPEIDLPGHTNAALHAIPELNTAGSSHTSTAQEPTAPANGTGNVGYSYLDPDSAASMTFIRHVLTQLAAITPGNLLHVGGDESHDFVARYGKDRFNTFVGSVLGVVHSLGKSADGWNEISRTPEITSGDQVQYWAGDTSTLPDATAAGAKVIMSRGSSSYLDMKYNSKTPIGLTWACSGICDFPQYYNWDPAKVVNGIGDAEISGVEAPMWSETVRGQSQAQFMIFPRAIAFAEMGWTAQSQRDVGDFTSRLSAVGPRLTAAGANFYDSPYATWQAPIASTDASGVARRQTTYDLGRLFAPGTVIADNGQQVGPDTNAGDADGASASVLTSLRTTISWGDGTPSTAGTFTAAQARDALHSTGTISVTGQHTYQKPGRYTGTISGSDGRQVPFTVTVRPR